MLSSNKKLAKYCRAGVECAATFHCGQLSRASVYNSEFTENDALLKERCITRSMVAVFLLEMAAYWSTLLLKLFSLPLHIFLDFQKIPRLLQDMVCALLSSCPTKSTSLLVQSKLIIRKNNIVFSNCNSTTGSLPPKPCHPTVTSCIHRKILIPALL